jgi:hypothetical protein
MLKTPRIYQIASAIAVLISLIAAYVAREKLNREIPWEAFVILVCFWVLGYLSNSNAPKP